MLKMVSRFLQVGALAFALDAGVLWLLVYVLYWPPIPARAVSFVATIALTFVLNARYTFVVPLVDASKARYVVIQCLGVALNFAMYSGLVVLLGMGPLWALVLGSASASAQNFLLIRRFVFVEATDKPLA